MLINEGNVPFNVRRNLFHEPVKGIGRVIQAKRHVQNATYVVMRREGRYVAVFIVDLNITIARARVSFVNIVY